MNSWGCRYIPVAQQLCNHRTVSFAETYWRWDNEIIFDFEQNCASYSVWYGGSRKIIWLQNVVVLSWCLRWTGALKLGGPVELWQPRARAPMKKGLAFQFKPKTNHTSVSFCTSWTEVTNESFTMYKESEWGSTSLVKGCSVLIQSQF